jgi:hypothetical protein
MALGALIIKERLGVSDREKVEQIRENPYLQYFIWLSSYSNEAPFEAQGKRISNPIDKRLLRSHYYDEINKQQESSTYSCYP